MSKKTLSVAPPHRLAGRLSPFRNFRDSVWEIRPRRAGQGLHAAVIGLCAADFGQGCPRDRGGRHPALSAPIVVLASRQSGGPSLPSRCYTGDWKSMPVSGIVWRSK